MTIEQIIEDFDLIDDWEEKYRYLIELGRTLEPLSEAEHSDANKVRGCASQVWLVTEPGGGGPEGPRLSFRGDSDAHIVRGLIAILLALHSGRLAREIAAADTLATFDRLGLKEHLTPQRSNGLASMAERIRRDAVKALGAPA